MNIRTENPKVHYDGKVLPRYDAVIPRIGASITSCGTSVVRQFKTIGTCCVNGSWGISSSRNKLHAHQIIARHQIGMPTTAFASSPKDTKNLVDLAGSTPLIVKLLESTQGKGVVLAETKKVTEIVISAFCGLKAEFLVQQFVKEALAKTFVALWSGAKLLPPCAAKRPKGSFAQTFTKAGSRNQ